MALNYSNCKTLPIEKKSKQIIQLQDFENKTFKIIREFYYYIINFFNTYIYQAKKNICTKIIEEKDLPKV